MTIDKAVLLGWARFPLNIGRHRTDGH